MSMDKFHFFIYFEKYFLTADTIVCIIFTIEGGMEQWH